ncbi:MAG: hypothetical protein ACYTFQ_27970 [Planctomycetota bacterium]|jgi:hypothetical protein
MRTIKKLSPTALHLWEGYREEFYKKYLSDNRTEREPQSPAMIVGSSFDAFVKCALHQHLFGNDGDGVYDLKRLFEEQCSNKELRPWAWEAGKYVFDCYRTWGCYDELLEELQQSEEDPRFEFELTGEIGGVPVVGKPDLWYRRDVQVVYDWKVMGFCSKNAVSPKKLYKTCRDCWGEDRAKPTRGFKGDPKPHAKYTEIDHHGHMIGDHFLEDVDKKWADQTAIYSWMMGVPVGDEDAVTGIDQIACKPTPDPDVERHPLIRVAQHRCRISRPWQESLLRRLQDCWNTIQSGHIFTDLSREDSDAQCEVLDMVNADDDNDEFWAAVNERQYRG